MIKRLTILMLLCLVEPAAADDRPSDSASSPAHEDSLFVADTLSPGKTLPDSLAESDTTLASFEERYEQFKKKRERGVGFSYFDTLVAYFTSERLNQRRQVDRSFFHDAGDYFRFDPSYFILEHQVTPLRKTVQPFGLPGNRLNLIARGRRLSPFEHIPEPDGLADLNDIPTALDGEIFVLPGPIGQIFGGRSSVATFLTRPREKSSYLPQSALLADKGSFGYSHVRGRYSKLFVDGREIDMSIGYRKADGPTVNRKDDAYHYFGDFYLPLAAATGLRAWGQLYNRDGNFMVRPDLGGETVLRERFDRLARLSLDFSNDDYSARTQVGYKHLRKGSYMTGVYKSRLNLTGHGAFALREWRSGKTIYQAQIDGDYLEYDDGPKNIRRNSGELSFGVAHLRKRYRWALAARARYVESIGLLPSAAAVLFEEGPRFLLMLSLGYSEREPSLLELHLPYQESAIYGAVPVGYAEEGNGQLNRERQLVTNVTVELGSPQNKLRLSATAGKIFDGIDWQNRPDSNSSGPFTLFSPINGDVTFVNLAFQPQLKIADILTFTSGAAHHYVKYDAFESKAYSPEYQFFSGMELHVYWPQRLLDLFAYGEVVYVGRYDGYDKEGLGKVLVANAKLSFGLKDFRFNFIFQNVLSQVYQAREYITFPGRYFYYNLTWAFLN